MHAHDLSRRDILCVEVVTVAALLKTLERFGIETDAEDIEQMVIQAMEELLVDWRPLEPQTNLSVAEEEELRDGGLVLEQLEYGKEDPVLQSATQYAALLATSLSVSQVAELLRVDGSRVRHRLAARTIYGIRLRSGWRIPIFQFEDGQVLTGIDLVLPKLPEDMHPLEIIGWFTTPDPDLVVGETTTTPREWLRLGKNPKSLIRLASSLDYEL
jgi:hypothetical protein